MKLIKVPQRAIYLLILTTLTLSYFLVDSKAKIQQLESTNELIIAQRDSMTIMWSDAMNKINN